MVPRLVSRLTVYGLPQQVEKPKRGNLLGRHVGPAGCCEVLPIVKTDLGLE